MSLPDSSSGGWGSVSSPSSGSGNCTVSAAASASGWGSAPVTSAGGWSSTASSGWGRSISESSASADQQQAAPRPSSPKQQQHVAQPASSWARAVSGSAAVPANCSSNSSTTNTSNNSRSHHCSDKPQPNSNPTPEACKSELEKEIRSVPVSAPMPAVDPVLLSAENWGQSVINQDHAWDLPSLPQDLPHSDRFDGHSASHWKSSIAGTEVWENSVRHKNNSNNNSNNMKQHPQQPLMQPIGTHQHSQPQQQQPQQQSTSVGTMASGPPVATAAPSASACSMSSSSSSNSSSSGWNHTPSTHIGGHWGEEEDSSIVWTGVPNGSSNHSHSSTSTASNGSWGTNQPINRQAATDAIPDPHPTSSGWKRPDDQQPLLQRHPSELRNNHNNGIISSSSINMQNSRGNGTTSGMSSGHNSVQNPAQNSGHNAVQTSGWEDSHHPHPDRTINLGWSASEPHSVVQRPTVLLRHDSLPVPNAGGWKREERLSNSCGWDVENQNQHLTNGIDKRQLEQQVTSPEEKNIDDGTSAWGNPIRQPAKIQRWKEEEDAIEAAKLTHHPVNAKMTVLNSANGMSTPVSPNGAPILSSPGMIRLPPSNNEEAWVKSQQPVMQSGPWNQEQSTGRESWNCSSDGGDKLSRSGWGTDPSSSLWNGSDQQSQRKGNWSDGQIDTSSWNGPKHKPLTKEMICASKQFRVLHELGFRKDDVESSLRAANMNLDDALSDLRSSWAADERRKTSPGNTPSTSLLTSAGLVPSPSLSSGIGTRSSGLPPAFPAQANEVTSALRGQSGNRVGPSQSNLPSEKQLLHLVQQIRLAVQTGHLNAQILNQPLAPPAIHLIYTLLQQIKHLQQLQIQVANAMSKPGANAAYQSHLHVQITQTKQRIANCQNQIAVQQALFMKHQQVPQQQQPPPPAVVAPQSQDMFRTSNDMNPMPDFRDLSLKEHQVAQNQSRFKTTWKLPSFEKDDVDVFSRAPGAGSSSKSRADTWTGLNEETGLTNWSDGSEMFKETVQPASSQQSSAPSTYLADLVPEFEPGKPWKGAVKNIEDDPHLTPGSVNRSPLSVNTIFNNWSSKVSPTDSTVASTGGSGVVDPLTSLSLSSSTWAFPASSSSSSGFMASDAINSSQKATSSSTWEPTTSESLWSGSSTSVSKPRGPPPGLSQSSLSQVNNKTSTSQQQPVSGSGSPASATGQHTFWENSAPNSTQGQQRWTEPRTSSGFLVLRNLTPQIDGSTLKTLCLQHGPVRLFHLLLQNGICLVQYSTQEEANKAQSALNNCVLGNTTILSHVPTESELKQLFNQVGQSTSSGWNSSSATQNGGGSVSGFRPGSGLGFNSAASNGPTKNDTTSSWSSSGTGLWNYSTSGSSAWDERPGGSGSGLQSNLDDLLGGESN